MAETHPPKPDRPVHVFLNEDPPAEHAAAAALGAAPKALTGEGERAP